MKEKFMNSEKIFLLNIFFKLKKRDFSGRSGMAVKNSIYQFSANLALKLGSLVFTILLARILMPDLFGLYNLALSTILVFFVISNMGIGPALVRFVSREIGKKNGWRAKSYVFYFGKLKLLITAVSLFLLLISAKFISASYYKKPIFLGLMAGALYILFYGVSTFLEYILQASNSFDKIFYKESFFQVVRVTLVPLTVFLFMKSSVNDQEILFVLFLALAFSYAIISIFVLLFQIKKFYFISAKNKALKKVEKHKVNRFLVGVSAMSFSGLFFEYVDKIMLGHFVSSGFIGYYAVAVGLMGTFIALEAFGTALLPIFSQSKGKILKEGLHRSIQVVSLISFLATIICFSLSSLMIPLIYGQLYSPATPVLMVLSFLLIPLPIAGVYSTFFISIGKPSIVARLLLISAGVNIVLNYFLITSFINQGELAAVLGAAVATLISQFFYLGGLIFEERKIRGQSL